MMLFDTKVIKNGIGLSLKFRYIKFSRLLLYFRYLFNTKNIFLSNIDLVTLEYLLVSSTYL